MIIKDKKFRDLDISRYFSDLPITYIEKWISLGQDNEILKQIYLTIRNLFTTIKNQSLPATTVGAFFTSKKAEKVPRFDKII